MPPKSHMVLCSISFISSPSKILFVLIDVRRRHNQVYYYLRIAKTNIRNRWMSLNVSRIFKDSYQGSVNVFKCLRGSLNVFRNI